MSQPPMEIRAAPYYAAACQTAFDCPAGREGIAERVKRMCDMAENTIIGYEPFFEVRLLAFPEFAHAAPIYDSVAKLRDRLAIPVPNEHTDRYARLCTKHGCYLQTGTFLEADPEVPDAVFNTTVLIGPAGVLTKYRKVNPWIPWELHASPHDLMPAADSESTMDDLVAVQRTPASVGLRARGPTTAAASTIALPRSSIVDDQAPSMSVDPFPVARTEIGNLGVAICYDWLFPETIRQIAFNGAEVIIRVSAYMDPWGATPPLDWWTLFNRARAAENTAYVVAANQGASMAAYPPFSWPGASMVVDYDGRILAQAEAGPGEKIVVAPIDIAALRAERQRRAGHDMRAHLRSEIHPYLRRSYLAPAGPDEPLTSENIRQRIVDAKQRVRELERTDG